MKINKIEISNFRGIKGKYELDFTNKSEVSKLLVLDGENGFGKTTIFDAIEFCMTGSIRRFVTNKDEGGIADDNKQKNILKNNNKVETLIKIIFEKDKEISIHLSETHEGGIDDKYTRLDENNLLINFNINDFKNTFYLPQENSTDLLKESKKGIKKFTDRLLNVDSENIFISKNLSGQGNIIPEIDNLIRNIKLEKDNSNKKLNDLNINLDELNKTSSTSKKIDFIDCKNLSDINYKWKIKEKYTKNDLDDSYISNWQSLLNLVQNKQGLYNYHYNKVVNNKIELINTNKEYFKDNYNYFLFFKLNQESKSEEIIKLKTEKKKYFGYKDNLEFLEKNNNIELEKIEKLFSELNSKDKFYDELFKIDTEYIKVKEKLKSLNNEQKEYNDIFGNLIDFWDKKFEVHVNQELIINERNDNIKSGTCPLCRSENKKDDIINQLKFLKKQSGIDIDKGKENLFSGIYSKELFKEIENYLEELEKQLTNLNLYEAKRKDIQTNKEIFEKIEVSVEMYYEESKLQKKEIKLFNFIEIIGEKEKIENNNLLEDIIKFGKEKIKDELINKKEFEELSIKYFNLFNKEYIFIEEIIKELKEEEIENNIDYFKNELIKLKDDEKKKLEKEIQIIENEIKFYEGRIIFLNFTNEKIIKKYSDKLTNKIIDFKDKKIKSIALPFYVFNQRIVKNYNGMKFYLTTDSINGEDGIKNPMYSLSSGQAEGLALSLMLSNNLSYNSEFKTILIDDPIQSLDDLNILSFINLLRYQFTDKQIIISTHDDLFSRFIRYKFWRLHGNDSQKNINMKDEFFNKK